MRNGDYIPSRLASLVETVGMIAQAKCDANPENTVGVVSTAGRPNVVLTLTPDVAKVYSNVDRIPITGTVDLLTSFHVAMVCFIQTLHDICRFVHHLLTSLPHLTHTLNSLF